MFRSLAKSAVVLTARLLSDVVVALSSKEAS